MNWKLWGSTLSAGMLGLILIVLAFLIGETDSIRYINVSLLVLGACGGWLIGTVASPYNAKEEKEFSTYTKAVTAFVSGYAVAKIDRAVDAIFSPDFLLQPVSGFRVIGFYNSHVNHVLFSSLCAIDLTMGFKGSSLSLAPLSQAVRFPEEVHPMFHPNQFQVNETWIIFKLNDAPVITDRDGDFNVFALMDAASCFILDTGFVSAESEELSQIEAKRILKNGHSHKRQYPRELIIPINQVANNLSIEAERCGIRVNRVPEEQLQVLIGEAREGFQEHISKGQVQ